MHRLLFSFAFICMWTYAPGMKIHTHARTLTHTHTFCLTHTHIPSLSIHIESLVFKMTNVQISLHRLLSHKVHLLKVTGFRGNKLLWATDQRNFLCLCVVIEYIKQYIFFNVLHFFYNIVSVSVEYMCISSPLNATREVFTILPQNTFWCKNCIS